MKNNIQKVAGTVFISSAIASSAAITSFDDLIGGGQRSEDGTTFTTVDSLAGTNDGTNNSPAGEAANFAIDGDIDTKYLNFGAANTGFIVTPAAGPSIATGMTFATANDASGRDPATFSIFGSNTAVATIAFGVSYDLSDFTLINGGNQDTGLVDITERLTFAPTQTFANTTAYTTYIVVFDTLRDPNDPIQQVAEAQIEGTVVPEPSSFLLLGLAGVGFASRRRR